MILVMSLLRTLCTVNSYPTNGAPLYTSPVPSVWQLLRLKKPPCLLTEAGPWPLIRFTYITLEHSSQHSQHSQPAVDCLKFRLRTIWKLNIGRLPAGNNMDRVSVSLTSIFIKYHPLKNDHWQMKLFIKFCSERGARERRLSGQYSN